MRRLALSLLLASPGPLKAYALLARLEERLGRRLSPPTVYRALDQLLAAGAIVRIESRGAFLPSDPAVAPLPRVILLCRECGTVRQMADLSIADGLRSLADAQQFSIGRSVVEIEGRCHDCAGGIGGEFPA